LVLLLGWLCSLRFNLVTVGLGLQILQSSSPPRLIFRIACSPICGAALAETKCPDQPPGTAWEYGADIGKVRELANYWQKDYD